MPQHRQAPDDAVTGTFVGRTGDLERVVRLVTGHRLTTLTGPPGVGKTRLALAAAEAVADTFADGVVVVDLTAVRDADLVLGEIASAVGPLTGGATAERLPQALAGRQVLVVLDNLEHLLAAAPALGDLVTTCPGLHLLVTSRERLHLRAEHEVPVLPLALPEPDEVADPARLEANPSVAMLVAQVRTFDPGFAVTSDNGEALAGICTRLDGLPLALELAAPRLRLFNPRELLFRLRHRVGPLAHDARDVPDRHRTLQAALSWSHDLLGQDERVMFRRLSVFSGGWTLEAAAQVCAVPDAVATTASLIDKSLVRRSGTAGDTARFGMLESLREFAADLLEQAGETEETADRHAAFSAEVAAHIDARVGTPDERTAIEEVGEDVGNLRAALAHCLARGRVAPALQLASALGWYAYTRGQLGAGQQLVETVLSAPPSVPENDTLAGALFMAGAVALARGDLDRAGEHLGASLSISERTGAVRRQAVAHAFLGHLARARNAGGEAVAHHERAGELHRQLGNVPGVAWSRYDLGLLARRRRDSGSAAQLLRESLLAFRDLHYAWAIGCSAWALATVDLRTGRADDAATLLAEALECFVVADDGRGVAQCLEASAAVACERSAPDTAAHLLGAAAMLRERLDAPLPDEEQGAHGAVLTRVRHGLGADAAATAERTGRAMSQAAAVDLARTVIAGGVTDRRPAPSAPLTRREHDVARLVRQGRTNRQIGRQLGIAEKTTEVHVHNIIRKLGASSRAEIAAWVAADSGDT